MLEAIVWFRWLEYFCDLFTQVGGLEFFLVGVRVLLNVFRAMTNVLGLGFYVWGGDGLFMLMCLALSMFHL